MTDRIDHAAKALGCLEAVRNANLEDPTPRDTALLQAAQVHATLAQVEQARIRNLIAIWDAHDADLSVSNQAGNALFHRPDMWRLRPDIAAALGVE